MAIRTWFQDDWFFIHAWDEEDFFLSRGSEIFFLAYYCGGWITEYAQGW